MAEKETLPQLLKRLMKDRGVGETSLIQLVNDRIGYPLLHRTSLQNWLREDPKKPQSWKPFIGIAIGLRLNSEDTDQLLSAAEKPLLAKLWLIAEGADYQLLELWQETQRKQADNLRERRSIPLELQPLAHNFTGREETIEAIVAALQPGKIIALCGPAGIGKTALAAEIINRLIPGDAPPPQFPDGVIYYSFYKKSGPLPALEHLITRFIPASTSDEDGLRDMARKVLSRKKALLVLDGTEACDDLRSILSVRGTCGVLLTSRYKRDAPQRRFDIEALTETEAASLLKKWADEYANHDNAVDQICDLVGRLPLAIRLVGSHLSQAKRTATEFLPVLEQAGLQALEFHQRQQESVTFLLKKNTERLSNAARQVLAIAGSLAFAPFSAEVMAAAQSTSRTEVQKQLDELVIWSLLDRRGQPYHLVHLLAYQFVQHYFTDLVTKKTIHRLLTYYATVVQERRDVKDYTRLDGDLPHLIMLIAKGTTKKLWDPILQLSKSIDEILDIRGQWTDRVTVNTARLTAAQNLKTRTEQGRALESLGTTYFLLGNYQAAVEAFTKALAIAVEIGDLPLKALVEQNWGNLLMRQDNQEQALARYQNSLETYTALGNRTGRARILNGLGNLALHRGDFHQARAFFEEVLAIFQALNDPKNDRDEAKVMDNLGLCHRTFGDMELALDFHQRALTKLEGTGDIRATLLVTMNMGSVLLEQGVPHKAEEQYKNSIQMSRAVGDLDSLSKALINLGITYRRQEKYDLAIKVLSESLKISEKLNNDARMGGVYNTLGLIYYERGVPEPAIRNYESALNHFRRIEDWRDNGITLHNLGDAYSQLQQFDEAKQYYQEALAIFQELKIDRFQLYPLKGLGDLYKKQDDTRQARMYWEQALAKSRPGSPEYKDLTDLLQLLDT